MKDTIVKKYREKLIFVSIVAVLLFSALFLWIGSKQSWQAKDPMIAWVSFEGEYRIGDGEFKPYVKGEHIPANRGDVTIRGIFLKHNPETGDVIGPLGVGNTVHLYFDHIGGTAILPGGGKLPFDAENERLGEDACAAMWGSVPATGDQPITIVLHNPHKFGNFDAIDAFFEHMSIAPGTFFESTMLERVQPSERSAARSSSFPLSFSVLRSFLRSFTFRTARRCG